MNLFSNFAPAGPEEQTDVLFGRPGLRLLRIVSRGHASPPDFWYDQPEDEWVAVLEGSGSIEFEDGRVQTLCRGDFSLIPAGTRHRVRWTDPEVPTIWLALHLAQPAPAGTDA